MLTLNKLIKWDGQQPEEMNQTIFKGTAASHRCLSAVCQPPYPFLHRSVPAIPQRSETTLQARW